MSATRKNAMLNIRPEDHARLKVVCSALGIRHIDAAAEALNAWVDQHEADALEAIAVQATQMKGRKGRWS